MFYLDLSKAQKDLEHIPIAQQHQLLFSELLHHLTLKPGTC